MGTRCLTNVFSEDGLLICTMYRQMDGYPSGHGLELAKFLKKIEVVNGIGTGARAGTHANGMDCLAAQIVARFKKGIGGFYLMFPRRSADMEDYVYEVRQEGKRVTLTIKAPKRIIFAGLASDAVKFCKEEKE